MATILCMGVIRFALTVTGVPHSTVKYFSMTSVIAAAAVYVAITTRTHRERLNAAFLLILPYMVIEVAALAYTWATGHQTIFHAEEYSFGVSVMVHTIGHLVGGLTWEPLLLFLTMELIWWIFSLIARPASGS